jgi:hypothetical protein
MSGDGLVNHVGLDNHGMGTILEALVRRFVTDTVFGLTYDRPGAA